MKIGLIDVDGHASKKKWGATIDPNLALCKIASYHKMNGDQVEWYDGLFGGEYDIVYMAKVFSVVSNLEWCNHSYNALYGTCQERLRKHKNTPVEMVDKTTHKVLAVFESMKVAMRETGVNKVTISMVCRGKRKIGGGYIWRYSVRCI